jgi:hypothetical protein
LASALHRGFPLNAADRAISLSVLAGQTLT